MKLVVEIVAAICTWVIVCGSVLAGMHIYHLMIVDLNRNLSTDKKIPMAFAFLDSRAYWYNVVKEHRKQFPDSKLYFYMRICYGLMLTWLGVLFWAFVIIDRLRTLH